MTTNQTATAFTQLVGSILEKAQQEKAQLPPPNEAWLRAIASLEHWYNRQPPTADTAATAAELVRILVYEYDRFWDCLFAIYGEGDPIRDAACSAVTLGIKFDTMAEVDEWLNG